MGTRSSGRFVRPVSWPPGRARLATNPERTGSGAATVTIVRLAPATRTDYEQCWEEIGPILGKCLIGSLRSTDIARYMRVERASAPSRANHEKALLSNLFFHGIDLGLCTDNPARLVRPNVEEPRTEAPQPDLLATFVEWAMKQSPQRRIVALWRPAMHR